MAKFIQALTIALALATSSILLAPNIGYVVQAKDAKTPPPKDPAPKKDSCTSTPSPGGGRAKTADKAFNAMDCYIRGRFIWWQPATPATQPADVKNKTLAK